MSHFQNHSMYQLCSNTSRIIPEVLKGKAVAESLPIWTSRQTGYSQLQPAHQTGFSLFGKRAATCLPSRL
jgi:hypothetical protein